MTKAAEAVAARLAKQAEVESMTARGKKEPTAEKAGLAPAVNLDLLPVFLDSARSPLERYDAALAISAQFAGKVPGASVGTDEGRAARLAEVKAALSEAVTPGARGFLAVELAALSRGQVPAPAAGLSPGARSALSSELERCLESCTDPRERWNLAGRLRGLRACCP